MGEEKKKKRRKQLNDRWSGDLHKMFSDISFCLCILNGGFHLLCYEFAFVLGIVPHRTPPLCLEPVVQQQVES